MNDMEKDKALAYLYDMVRSRLQGKENSAGFYRCECPFGWHDKVDKNQASYNIRNGYFQCQGNADHNRTFRQMLEWAGLNETALPTYTPKPLPAPAPKKAVLWDDKWYRDLVHLDACAGLRAWLVTQGIHAEHHVNFGYTGQDSRLPHYARNKLAIAWEDVNYKIIGVKLRSLPTQPKFYCSIEGSDFTGHLYNYHSPNYEQDIVIQETERDTSALCEWTGRPYLGTAAPTSHWTGPLKDYYFNLLAQFPNVYVARDRGEAGDKMMAAIWSVCRRAIELLPTEGNKDLGECFASKQLPDWLPAMRGIYPDFSQWKAS